MDRATILESYRDRKCSLDLAAESTKLSQRNHTDQHHNRHKITQADLGNRSIIGSLSVVQYGKWDGEDACLVAFRFQFLASHNNAFRFTKARIKIEFQDRPGNTLDHDPDNDPVVVTYGPKEIRSEGTEIEILDTVLGSIPVAIGVGIADKSPRIEASRTKCFSRHAACTIQGNYWSDANHENPNGVIFNISEDIAQKNGIPNEFKAALVIKIAQPAKATVDIQTSLAFDKPARLFTKNPWSRDDPILLQPGIELHPVVLQGNDLKTVEWQSLLTYNLDSRNTLMSNQSV